MPMFKEDFGELEQRVQEDNVVALVNYLPYGKSNARNEAHGSNGNKTIDAPLSLAILNVKQLEKPGQPGWKKKCSDEAAAFFIFVLSRLLAEHEELKIVTVPSSTQGAGVVGITAFCVRLASKIKGAEFKPEFLTRTESVPKASRGGERNAERHQETMQAALALSGRAVLLIDDVITSGASREASVALIKGAGAHAVYFLALGKTLSERSFSDGESPLTLASQMPQIWVAIFSVPRPLTFKKGTLDEGAAKINGKFRFYVKPGDIDLGVLLLDEQGETEAKAAANS